MQVFKIFIQEIPFHPDLQEQFQKLILSKLQEKFSVNIRKFQQQGAIVDWSPITVIRLTASTLIGYVLSRTFFGQREDSNWDDEKERETTITYIMKGLAP
jgi:hypothetical protein